MRQQRTNETNRLNQNAISKFVYCIFIIILVIMELVIIITQYCANRIGEFSPFYYQSRNRCNWPWKLVKLYCMWTQVESYLDYIAGFKFWLFGPPILIKWFTPILFCSPKPSSLITYHTIHRITQRTFPILNNRCFNLTMLFYKRCKGLIGSHL